MFLETKLPCCAGWDIRWSRYDKVLNNILNREEKAEKWFVEKIFM